MTGAACPEHPAACEGLLLSLAVTSALKCSHLGSHLTDGIREQIQGKKNHLVSVCPWESLGKSQGGEKHPEQTQLGA